MNATEIRKIITTTLTDEQLEKAAAYFSRVTGMEPASLPEHFKAHVENVERHLAPKPEFDPRMYGVPADAHMNDSNEQNEPE